MHHNKSTKNEIKHVFSSIFKIQSRIQSEKILWRFWVIKNNGFFCHWIYSQFFNFSECSLAQNQFHYCNHCCHSFNAETPLFSELLKCLIWWQSWHQTWLFNQQWSAFHLYIRYSKFLFFSKNESWKQRFTM